jgi:hypothetical protein
MYEACAHQADDGHCEHYVGHQDRRSPGASISYIRSKILYAAPVYYHVLPPSRRRQTGKIERKTLRFFTGCLHAPLMADLHRQANLPPLSLQVRATTSTHEGKYRRSPEGAPMRVLAFGYLSAQTRLNGALRRTW